MSVSKPIFFSVIVPSLNSSKFIRGTIDSIVQQKYPHKEIIVIDGVSTDETLLILEEYQNFIQLISEKDSGQANAINKGLRMASGEIVSWLNADDILFPDCLETVANVFFNRPAADIVYGRCDYIDATGFGIKPYPTQAYDYQELVEKANNFFPQPACGIISVAVIIGLIALGYFVMMKIADIEV